MEMNEPITLSTDQSELWNNHFHDPVYYNSPVFHIIRLEASTKFFKDKFADIREQVKLEMLTFIEFNLSWISFMIKDYQDLDNLTLEAMEQLHDDIGCVKQYLQQSNSTPVDEDRAHLIESHFQDILEALKYCIQRRDGAGPTHEDGIPSEAWQPFFRSQEHFGTEDERLFVTKLRRLYLKRKETSGAELISEMTHIFESTPSGSVLFKFEGTRGTAICSVKSILQEACYAINDGYRLDWDQYDYLDSYLRSISELPLLHNEGIHSLDDGMPLSHEMSIISLILITLHCENSEEEDEEEDEGEEEEENGPVLEHAPIPGSSPTSVLWQKLGTAESVSQIIEEAGQRNCSICIQRDVTTVNFGILDMCRHLFCHDCIDKWFENKSTCPYCRTVISQWTTRDFFLTFLEQNRRTQSEETERKESLI